MFGGPQQGTWIVRSKSDPRWNCSGRALLLVTAGEPPEAKAKLADLGRQYGQPPEDLTFSCMKD